MASTVQIFGVRHHGPGCARSLKAGLEAFAPDCVLIEGPPDVGAELLALAGEKGLKPPIALLVYAVEEANRAAFYPFAVFSPEWQAIQYALKNKSTLRFMDLPMVHRFALDKAEEEKFAADMKAKADTNGGEAGGGESDDAEDVELMGDSGDSDPLATAPADAPDAEQAESYADPLAHLARAAGYADAESWWDHMIESRGTATEPASPADLFAATLEAMTALRETLPPRPDRFGHYEAQREAWMRQTIRTAMKEGHEKIAVICGAWHAPVLHPDKMPPEKSDAEILAKLPKVKTAAAWVPWTYGRLASASGYGAGITSPGWYHHLFDHHDKDAASAKKSKKAKVPGAAVVEPAHASALSISWLTKVAHLLRKEDLDASSAHIIETVRLAESLAAMRDRPAPSLLELTEATRTVLLFGDTAPLALIHNKLIVSERLGEVPAEGAVAPLQLDLQRQQKRLRLSPDAAAKNLELDLRKPNDLEKSELLHRLNLLNIPWGHMQGAGGRTKGTFKEIWTLKWEPEFAVRLIEVSSLGNTIYDAASAHARRTAAVSRDLPVATELLDKALQANLPEAVAFLLKRIDTLAAVAADLLHMMGAVPPLANVVRYGNVRKTDTTLVARVVAALFTRIMAGLPPACGSLNDDAAAQMETSLSAAHAAVQLLYPPTPKPTAASAPLSPGIAIPGATLSQDDTLSDWLETLAKLADQSGLHGLVAGRVTRLLLDASRFTSDESAQRMSLALSVGNDPAQGAAWIEGFLKGSGLILLHDEDLWTVLDGWVSSLPEEPFTTILPLLRRSFAQFPAPERAQMGQRLKGARGGGKKSTSLTGTPINEERATKVLPVLKMILGGLI